MEARLLWEQEVFGSTPRCPTFQSLSAGGPRAPLIRSGKRRMAKLRGRRGYRFIKELGGAVDRKTVSFGASWLVSRNLVRGRVLDYGCGFGFDADHFAWCGFDPYYRQEQPTGKFDTIICNHVLNMLTRSSRRSALHAIRGLLSPTGIAWLIVPRNIPRAGKVALRRRIQNFVQLSLPSVYADERLEIYRMDLCTGFEDKTDEIERRLSRS